MGVGKSANDFSINPDPYRAVILLYLRDKNHIFQRQSFKMAKTRTVNAEQDDLFIQDLLKLDQGTDSVSIDRFQYLRHIYRQMPVGIALTIFCSTLTAWLIRFQVPHYLLIPWLVFITSSSGLHIFLVREFNKKRSHIGTSSNWSAYNTFLCTIAALSWGIGSLLFFPFLSPVMQMLFLGILTLYVIACLPVMAALYSGYLLFISVIAAFLILCFLIQPIENKVAAILALVSVYVFLMLIAAYFNRSLLGAFSLAVKLKDNFHYLYDLNELTRVDNIQLRKKITEHAHRSDRLISEKEHAEITLQWRLSARASLLNRGATNAEQQRVWITNRPKSEVNFICCSIFRCQFYNSFVEL